MPIKPFAPAIALMNRLTYPQKFLLISMLFILPLTLVMYLLLTELSMQREFSQKELYGTTYLRPSDRCWKTFSRASWPSLVWQWGN